MEIAGSALQGGFWNRSRPAAEHPAMMYRYGGRQHRDQDGSRPRDGGRIVPGKGALMASAGHAVQQSPVATTAPVRDTAAQPVVRACARLPPPAAPLAPATRPEQDRTDDHGQPIQAPLKAVGRPPAGPGRRVPPRAASRIPRTVAITHETPRVLLRGPRCSRQARAGDRNEDDSDCRWPMTGWTTVTGASVRREGPGTPGPHSISANPAQPPG